LVALEQFEGAVPVLQKAAQLDPQILEVHFQLGQALRGLGRETEGMRELHVFSAARDRLHAPSPFVPLDGAGGQRLWADLRSLAESGDEQAFLVRVQEMGGKGNLRLRAGAVYCVMSRTREALKSLDQARQEEPANAEVRAWMGRAHLLERNAPAAESEFQAALKLDGLNQTALSGLGELRYRQRRWTEAVRYFEDSKVSEPDLMVDLCDAYLQLGDREDARIAAELVRILAPQNQRILAEIEQLLAQHR
jgi:tetratricopeptide (TPR) repeat protein